MTPPRIAIRIERRGSSDADFNEYDVAAEVSGHGLPRVLAKALFQIDGPGDISFFCQRLTEEFGKLCDEAKTRNNNAT